MIYRYPVKAKYFSEYLRFEENEWYGNEEDDRMNKKEISVMICMESIKLVRSTCHPRHHHHHSYHLPWMERKVDIFKIDLPSGHTFLRIFKTVFFINSIFRICCKHWLYIFYLKIIIVIL